MRLKSQTLSSQVAVVALELSKQQKKVESHWHKGMGSPQGLGRIKDLSAGSKTVRRASLELVSLLFCYINISYSYSHSKSIFLWVRHSV